MGVWGIVSLSLAIVGWIFTVSYIILCWRIRSGSIRVSLVELLWSTVTFVLALGYEALMHAPAFAARTEPRTLLILITYLLALSGYFVVVPYIRYSLGKVPRAMAVPALKPGNFALMCVLLIVGIALAGGGSIMWAAAHLAYRLDER